MNHPDFSQITEAPGLQATQEQLERIYHRYHFAKQFCKGKDVVEVACGSGIGLGYLSSFSNEVSAGDIDEKNISIAQKQYSTNPKIKIQKIDAHQLPYPDNSCDVVLLYEAIYYLQNPRKFVDESWRILRNDGTLIIGTVNREWKDFHPSPFTHKYFSSKELHELISEKFSSVQTFGAFEVEQGFKASVFSLLKRMAVKFDLIPGSLKLRAYLKRIFIGKTFSLPDGIHEGIGEYRMPEKLNSSEKVIAFKILYAVGKK
ncbi:MAG: class I SAM-dependent methyltransferase [Bacteroidetes bacterium]|nr:class I SAM-dependent methyltransferase [Bacteroidota bacterium]